MTNQKKKKKRTRAVRSSTGEQGKGQRRRRRARFHSVRAGCLGAKRRHCLSRGGNFFLRCDPGCVAANWLCVSCELVCVCVSLVRVVIICLASTHTALVSSPRLTVLHLPTYIHTRLGALYLPTIAPIYLPSGWSRNPGRAKSLRSPGPHSTPHGPSALGSDCGQCRSTALRDQYHNLSAAGALRVQIATAPDVLRACAIGATASQRFSCGSYASAVARGLVPCRPPAT